MGRLRAFIVALVVAFHAVLAYVPGLPPPRTSLLTRPRWWGAFPTVDPQHWTGWAVFVAFNDIFFMSLMFFLSGLFVRSSLQRKRTGRFLRDRFVRLGLPFIVTATILAPVAYYPAYMQTTDTPTPSGFWQQWRSLGPTWPAGPVWFLWVLLVFDCAAALLHTFAPCRVESANRTVSSILRYPFACFSALALLSSLSYVPMAMAFGPLHWTIWGPFVFQTSRIIHYAVYFAAGVIVGAETAEQFLLIPGGPLAKRWIFWPAASLVTFIATSAIPVLGERIPAHLLSLEVTHDLAWTLACAATSFACLSLFLRFAKSQGPVLDNFCACGYGIYLIHYPIVNWLQHALLFCHLSALLKGSSVILGGLALSWCLIHILRHSRLIARVI